MEDREAEGEAEEGVTVADEQQLGRVQGGEIEQGTLAVVPHGHARKFPGVVVLRVPPVVKENEERHRARPREESGDRYDERAERPVVPQSNETPSSLNRGVNSVSIFFSTTPTSNSVAVIPDLQRLKKSLEFSPPAHHRF